MIKIKIYLDGNQFGYAEYTCKMTMKELITEMNDSAPLIGLADAKTHSFISFPKRKYLIEAREIDD